MTSDDEKTHSSAGWTGGEVATHKWWFDRWADRHPVLVVLGGIVLLAYLDLPERHYGSTFEFAVAMTIAVIGVSAVFGSAAAGLYLFVGLVKRVVPERYATLGTGQKWYVQLLFGTGAIASFAAGPWLLIRGLQMIGGTP